jgi:hypothetical protein
MESENIISSELVSLSIGTNESNDLDVPSTSVSEAHGELSVFHIKIVYFFQILISRNTLAK